MHLILQKLNIIKNDVEKSKLVKNISKSIKRNNEKVNGVNLYKLKDFYKFPNIDSSDENILNCDYISDNLSVFNDVDHYKYFNQANRFVDAATINYENEATQTAIKTRNKRTKVSPQCIRSIKTQTDMVIIFDKYPSLLWKTNKPKTANKLCGTINKNLKKAVNQISTSSQTKKNFGKTIYLNRKKNTKSIGIQKDNELDVPANISGDNKSEDIENGVDSKFDKMSKLDQYLQPWLKMQRYNHDIPMNISPFVFDIMNEEPHFKFPYISNKIVQTGYLKSNSGLNLRRILVDLDK